MKTFDAQAVGTEYHQGSPRIEPSRPSAEYQPRRDQIEAVMKKNPRMTAEEARAVCVSNFTAWRDVPRKWKWIQSAYGTYVQVEDK